MCPHQHQGVQKSAGCVSAFLCVHVFAYVYVGAHVCVHLCACPQRWGCPGSRAPGRAAPCPTFHDGDVHGSPPGAGHAAQAGAVGDGGAAPAWHQPCPGDENKDGVRAPDGARAPGMWQLSHLGPAAPSATPASRVLDPWEALAPQAGPRRATAARLLPVNLRGVPLDLGTGLHHLLCNTATAGS